MPVQEEIINNIYLQQFNLFYLLVIDTIRCLLPGNEALNTHYLQKKAVFSVGSVQRNYLEDNRLRQSHKICKLGMICSVMPILAEDLCVVQKEAFSITCYMCKIYTR
jgi:hypothetical protein